MDISTTGNVVTIKGNIKTVMDYQSIKENIDSVAASHDAITVRIVDSISITSSIIGYFNKLILKDKVKIEMKVGNSQLLELFEDLSLTSLFNVKKA